MNSLKCTPHSYEVYQYPRFTHFHLDFSFVYLQIDFLCNCEFYFLQEYSRRFRRKTSMCVYIARKVWRYQKHWSMKDRRSGQWNGQQKDKQRSTKHYPRTSLNTGDELMCSGRASSSSPSGDTRCVTLVACTMICRQWGKDRIVITIKGTFILQSIHLLYKYAIRINCCFIRTRRINFSYYTYKLFSLRINFPGTL